MAQTGKEPAIQQILRRDPTFSHKTNSQGSQELEQQKIAEIPVDAMIKRLSKIQTEVAIGPVKKSRSLVGDPAKVPTVDSVRSHGGQSIGGAQSQPYQNKNLSGGMQLLPQRDVNAIEVDLSEVSDPRIVKVVADQATANRADNLFNFISDSEIRVRVIVLRKQKEKAELKAKLEHLERKKTGGFIGKQNQISSDEHACQLILERSKCI